MLGFGYSLPIPTPFCVMRVELCSVNEFLLDPELFVGVQVAAWCGFGCHVTFSNCHFDISVVALAGARVTLRECSFENVKSSGLSLFAQARSMCVVESCYFSGGG